MSALDEVAAAYSTLKNNGARSIALLHCTSSYPASYDEVNLKAIQTLRDHFKTVVGYSDHTEGIEVAVAAVALGAEIIEKHLTLDRGLPGPDHKASIEPGQFRMMTEAIRNVEKALGAGEKLLQSSERKIRDVVQKSLVAKEHIRKGELFTMDNLTAKRAGRGIPASDWILVQGVSANRNYSPNELIDL
jgi:N,N'-diacetyllegionaminate synthase